MQLDLEPDADRRPRHRAGTVIVRRMRKIYDGRQTASPPVNVHNGALRTLRPLAVLAVLLVGVTSAACSTSSPAATQTTHPTSNFGQQSVPNQLWGTWESTGLVAGPNGQQIGHLVFSEHSYAMYGPDVNNAAIGRAWGGGPEQVNLGARGPCDSYGTYTWKIDAGMLTLSDGSNDSCQRRQPLTSVTYRKTSDSTKPADTDATV